ncbi:pyrroline-5-carboxylate reductase [Lachnospiraceae bacterium MD1]|uniref:Pyrroline-5-carboxylate reductase n=1 Tax=Variimorphobacter saccharofermentans TaxID=2755051 RepID=A0A839JZF6_9FIRM|nr:pyrroline-5-carboxylate reductase [Variimorphobacter saccharofermentans]MBB2183063.1 pyrroline-5-carboxylate reductase [Variimorphobacter saccharofermentans]
MALFGFIGAGNMGLPLMKAAAATFGKNEVIFTDASKERSQFVSDQTGIRFLTDNCSVVKQCKNLVLAVKPQFFPVVLNEIKDVVTKDQIVISIAAGIKIESIKSMLSNSVRIVRAMPNTPAMVLQGMSGICFSEDTFTDEEKEIIDRFFKSFGKYEVFDERLMNAVVCANGSSPAYVYMFIEALADSVVSYGIPRDKAYELAAQTVLGSAALVLETGEHPGKLKDQVCSPGGTTIAAVKALEEYGFRNAIMKATDACYKKCEELSNK